MGRGDPHPPISSGYLDGTEPFFQTGQYSWLRMRMHT
nr:MAG TPA: hypothetical protein [Bacteriophage sp.]